MSEPSSGLFEKDAAKIQAAVRQAFTDGKARIEIRPSAEHMHPIDSQPLIEAYADNELLGRFETYTQAAQYIVYVANAAGAYRSGFFAIFIGLNVTRCSLQIKGEVRMQFGERVVLMRPYRDMAAGTPLIYLSHGRDSGYLVAVCIREDELYADWLKKHKVSSFQEYLNTLNEQHAAVFRNMTEHRQLDFSVVKPDADAVTTLQALDQSLQQAQDEATRLEQIRTNFLLNVGNIALDFGGEHE